MDGILYAIYVWILSMGGIRVGDLGRDIDGREGASERAKVDMRLNSRDKLPHGLRAGSVSRAVSNIGSVSRNILWFA